MKKNTIIGLVADLLSTIRLGGKKGDGRLNRLDCGVLEISLMIAALDGTILPAEVAAYYFLLGKCRGCDRKSVPLAFDAALRRAGYLLALRQVGMDELGLLAAFLKEATEALPVGFAGGKMVDVRRAFVFWNAMGMSDGTFSDLERQAVRRLNDTFADGLLEEDFHARAEQCLTDMAVLARCETAYEALNELIGQGGNGKVGV